MRGSGSLRGRWDEAGGMRLGALSRAVGRVTGDQVYAELHGEIVRGVLRPGDTLTETRVAERFGLSRTPVREVFWRLGEDGFLRVVPQVGTYVAPINVPAVYDSQFIRETLECRTVADAARAATAGHGAVLRTMLAAQHAAIGGGDFAAFFALDEAMHRHLMEMAGRPFAWQVIAGAKAQLDRVRFLSLEDGAWPGMIMGQHEAIVGHVLAGDGRAATEVMRAHLRTAFAAIGRIARRHPEFFEGLGTHADEAGQD